MVCKIWTLAGESFPGRFHHEVADAQTEKVEYHPLKAPADEGSLEPSFLNVAPGGNTRAQRSMAFGVKTRST